MRPTVNLTADTFAADALHILPWPDEVIDSLGFDPRSAYVETTGRPPLSESGECSPRPVHSVPRATRDRQRDERDLPPRLVVRRLPDPVVEEHGFPVHSAYVEMVVLPILGPSTTLCLRRLTAWVIARPTGVTVDLAELAGELGLGRGVGRQSPIRRTLERMCQFGMATWEGGDLAVRTAVAPVTERQLDRLSPRLVEAHRAMVASLGPRKP